MHQYCFTYLMVKLRGMEMFRHQLNRARNAVTGGRELWENTWCNSYPVRDVPEHRVRALR